MSSNQRGAVNVLIFPLIICILLLIAAVVFGFWAFGSRNDYKNNTDQKIAVAVNGALKQEDAKKDAQFAEDSKYPLKPYDGPSNYGSIHIEYPRTWSAYVDDTGQSGDAIDGWWYPNYVPAVTDQNNSYALRIALLNQAYSDTLQALTDNANAGTIQTSPYSFPKVPKVVGTRVEGQITDTKSGTMIIMPLRDKTLEVWTEASQFQNDFTNNILPNLSFSP